MTFSGLDRRRASLWVAFLALAAFVNSLGNGFALDDQGILVANSTVNSGEWLEAWGRSYWPTTQTTEGAGLYRPFTISSFALEWRLGGGSPFVFHLGNVLSHLGVCLLLLHLLLAGGVPVLGATVGAGLFAIHPVHVEAVANVVGRSELYAALFFLAAALLFLRRREMSGARRIGATAAIGLLYLLSLTSKEIGVTLPGVLVLLALLDPGGTGAPDSAQAGTAPLPTDGRAEAAGGGRVSPWRRVIDDLPLWTLLASVLLFYLVVRASVLGTVTGEVARADLGSLATGERIAIAFGLIPEVGRLLLWPFDLAIDYAPGVLTLDGRFGSAAALGLMFAGAAFAIGWAFRRRRPALALAVGWFALTWLPVSQLFFPTGVLLAERTLYLPSVALAWFVGVLAPVAGGLRPRLRRGLSIGLALLASAFFMRTATRNPTWMETFTVMQTLAAEHPESYRAHWSRGVGLRRVGDLGGSLNALGRAVELQPGDYSLLGDAAQMAYRAGRPDLGEEWGRRATRLIPAKPEAWHFLGWESLRAGRFRTGLEAALGCVAACSASGVPEAWRIASEAYVAQGRIPSAIRAREAALYAGDDPETRRADRERLEVLNAAAEGIGGDGAGTPDPGGDAR